MNPVRSSIICPIEFGDLNEAGSIYFVKRKAEVEKKAHFAVAIDITGLSTNKQFVSTHYDMYIYNQSNHTTYIQSSFKHDAWDHYQLITKVGQIPLDNIRRFYSPIHFSKDLEQQLMNHVYYPMCQLNQGAHWSSTLNCQTFTRSAIEYLGCKLPSNVTVLSDCVPTMVDIYMSASLLKAQSEEKLNEK